MDGDFPSGWERWDEGPDRLILAYRPDVFDGSEIPSACMPTLYVTQGKRTRRPGRNRRETDSWFVTFYLEPEVTVTEQRFDDRDAAIEGAREFATTFVAGEIDYRDAYQVARPEYFTALDSLVGEGAAE